ncbi:YecA family protein [Pseudonocardia sp. TRM90224]|uniref:YecA family protein n=1 Tax=Pseudonocardia sp. TRM90224 TaxID=2812678 RepID=UPI001E2856FA|nr:SEC-C metal-binding domain-containing protein [Pseudonocardia sp. TRM90224]
MEPLDQVTEIAAAYTAVLQERGPLPADEVKAAVVERVGLDMADPAVEAVVESTYDVLLTGESATLALVAPDVVAHLETLVAGSVLTHRLSEAEHAEGYLLLDADLGAFLCFDAPTHEDEPLFVDDLDDGPMSWGGMEGWLDAFRPGALLAVSVAADSQVTIVEAEAPEAPDLAAHLREVYDSFAEDAPVPVPLDYVVAGMVHREPDVFAAPRPPLGELVTAVGLEWRDGFVAHTEEMWQLAEQLYMMSRLADGTGSEEAADTAFEAITVLTDPAAEPADLRATLTLLTDPIVLLAVTEEMLGGKDDPGRLAQFTAVTARLVELAGDRRAAAANWMAAVAAEREGRVLDAEPLLRAAERADNTDLLVTDRLGWYASDRGDAAEALRRWTVLLDEPEHDPDVQAVLPHANLAAAPQPGRNEPCWCGSGRKFKQCHAGKPVLRPLPERAAWLYRKAAAYLQRRGGAATAAVGWSTDALAVDTLMREEGWFTPFLADRGPLLPADEAELAATWTDIDRTVFEVLDPRTLRDERTGTTITVAEPAPADVGDLVCARALPDGGGAHILIAPFVIDPENRDDLLGLLARHATAELLEWVDAVVYSSP